MASDETRPNVVVVITDDQGYGDVSCHGNPILKTPNIDRLAGESVRLKDYHVSPTCSPTRAAFLTGHWSNRTGVWHTIMGRSMLRENETTMGHFFKTAGYATGMFGKWHLGDNYPFRPEDRGFTEVLRHGGGGVGQTPDYWDNAYFDGSYWHNSTPTPASGYCTDVYFEYAKRFISAQKQAKKPFLVYLSTNAPHGPLHCPVEFAAPYKEHGDRVANFFGMISNIDQNVGNLRSFLKNEGLAENTIFVFTTDNGTAGGRTVFNAGMRGFKGSEYDGGHRVPFFIHWPAGNLASGLDVEPITAHVDIVPTLLELCNIEQPSNANFDGTSIASLLHGKSDSWPDRILVTDSQRVKDPIKWRKSAVMTSRWRLVNGTELYDIKLDPGQKNNVAVQNPDVKLRLTKFYDSWWQELLPTFQNATAIYLGHERENPARLTSHDWISTKTTPWNQSHVRNAMAGPGITGFWNVKIVAAGTYEFSLRRWPLEIDMPIDSPLPPGDPVPGSKAFRETPGKKIVPHLAKLRVGNQTWESKFEPGAKQVVFSVELAPGTTEVSGTFVSENGKEFGAYFVYVEKK